MKTAATIAALLQSSLRRAHWRVHILLFVVIVMGVFVPNHRGFQLCAVLALLVRLLSCYLGTDDSLQSLELIPKLAALGALLRKL